MHLRVCRSSSSTIVNEHLCPFKKSDRFEVNKTHHTHTHRRQRLSFPEISRRVRGAAVSSSLIQNVAVFYLICIYIFIYIYGVFFPLFVMPTQDGRQVSKLAVSNSAVSKKKKLGRRQSWQKKVYGEQDGPKIYSEKKKKKKKNNNKAAGPIVVFTILLAKV